MAAGLGWDKTGKRWRKWHNGKWRYFSERNTLKTDKAAYDAALQRWHQYRGSVPKTTTFNQDRLTQMAEWYVEQGDTENAKRVEEEAKDPETARLSYSLLPQEAKAVWHDRFDRPTKPKRKNIGEAVTEFLAMQQLRITASKLSLGT